jgi:hypothetical protein
MIALHWYPDRRQAMERSLLDEYLRDVGGSRSPGYDRPYARGRVSIVGALANDARRVAIVNNIRRRDLVEWLERIMLAVDDLDCRSLLA